MPSDLAAGVVINEISISLIAPAKCSTVIYIIFACSIP